MIDGFNSFSGASPMSVPFSSSDRSKVVTPLRSPGIRAVERILAIEARAANLEKAKFIGSLLGISNVESRHANPEQLQLASLGCFAAIFCSGLLYHLPEPWRLISKLLPVAPSPFG